jgi:2-acylglycerol O-acyltransferase 2
MLLGYKHTSHHSLPPPLSPQGFGQLISFAGGVDAGPKEVSKAIKDGCSVSICPGGIAEMFWGYPKEGCLPREEYAFLRSRKGFIRIAMKHNVPVVPVYCFGNTHAMHKAKTPWILEALSRSVNRGRVG